MMDETRFWNIIESSRKQAISRTRPPGRDVIDDHIETLSAELEKLPPADVAGFAARFQDVRARAYHWKLWGAAYWIGGGCGNDGFTDFRSTLISLGRKTYEAAVADADSPADLIGKPNIPFLQSEGFQYVASDVYRKLTGEEIPDSAFDEVDQSAKPAGERWDFEDAEATAKRLPRILKVMPEMGD